MDEDRANALLTKLGSIVVNSAAAGQTAWSSLAIIVEIQGSVRVSGYLFSEASDEAISFLPDEEFDDLLPEFHAATSLEGKASWLACLLQIDSANMQIRITFEYDDAKRWAISPANLATLVPALRW